MKTIRGFILGCLFVVGFILVNKIDINHVLCGIGCGLIITIPLILLYYLNSTIRRKSRNFLEKRTSIDANKSEDALPLNVKNLMIHKAKDVIKELRVIAVDMKTQGDEYEEDAEELAMNAGGHENLGLGDCETYGLLLGKSEVLNEKSILLENTINKLELYL